MSPSAIAAMGTIGAWVNTTFSDFATDL